MFISDPDIYSAHLRTTIARLTQYQVRYPVIEVEDEDGCQEWRYGFCSCEDCSELVEDDEAIEDAIRAYELSEETKFEAAYEAYLEDQNERLVERRAAWVRYLSSCIGESKPEDCGCGWGDCYICEQ